MSKVFRVALLFLSLSLTALTTQAQDLWEQLRIVKDPEAELTPDQAWQQTQSIDAIKLQQINQVLSAANSPPYWAGFSVSKTQFDQQDVWLSLKSPTQDHSQVWVRLDEQDWQSWPEVQQTGAGSYLFPVWILPRPSSHKVDVLIRLQGVNRMQFPASLQTSPIFIQQHLHLVLLIGAVLAVPLLLVLFALCLMPHVGNAAMWLFVLMAVCEIVCASWISGLLCFLWPSLTRAQAANLGIFSYWVLFVASIHHAQFFLNTAKNHPKSHQMLTIGVWFWYVAMPLCAWMQPTWLRSLLLIGGSVHACAMLLLAWQSWIRSPSRSLVLFAGMWFVYVTSVTVYWLYRFFEWPLLVTLGVQFVQGAFMASLMGLSACLQVVQQRLDLQRHVLISQARHRWYAAAQHDLWQPLQSVQLYARALLQVKVDKRPGLVAALQLASQSVDDYMHQLRYWAQEGSLNNTIGSSKQIAIDDVLSPLVQEFQPLAQMRYVVLRYRYSQAVVCINQMAVQRMVRNLLANALRYTSAGGRVLLGCKRQGQLLWILCIDNGSGMNSQAAQDCFNAFTRLAPDDEGVHHLGLGLFSVKQLALQHQIPTRLHSVEGRGTVIGFAVPVV